MMMMMMMMMMCCERISLCKLYFVFAMFFDIAMIAGYYALPETNIAPEKRSSQKEISSSNHPFSGAMLVSGRVEANTSLLYHQFSHQLSRKKTLTSCMGTSFQYSPISFPNILHKYTKYTVTIHQNTFLPSSITSWCCGPPVWDFPTVYPHYLQGLMHLGWCKNPVNHFMTGPPQKEGLVFSAYENP